MILTVKSYLSSLFGIKITVISVWQIILKQNAFLKLNVGSKVLCLQIYTSFIKPIKNMIIGYSNLNKLFFLLVKYLGIAYND